jgi:3-hydroxyacyl-CoA dehydrogenase/enoyl-CoA hydratase/3-hydroxybutyryl-CoA epimerase
MSDTCVTLSLDSDGIAILTLDVPGRSMNVITEQMMHDLVAHIAKIKSDPAIKGAVITSGKPAFMAGADLEMLRAMAVKSKTEPMEALFEAAFTFNRVFRDLETCGKPFVAALGGLALGGGLELALACHYRIVADDPKIQLGLPEVKVGLMPGAGGTQRLPRLMGVQPSLPYLLQGKTMSPQEALAFGVVHKVVAAADLLNEAKKWILGGGRPVQPWDEKRFKVPGGQGSMNATIAQTFMAATAMTREQTKDNYPAPQAILSAVYEGHQVPLDTAIRIETKLFTTLLLDPTAANMIRTLFVNKGEADKLIRRPKDVPANDIRVLGVLGAGMMGAGIAYVSALAGIEVILLDRDIPSAEKGKDYSRGLIEKSVARGRMSKDKAEAILARIRPTVDYADLAGADLVIEAVFEDAKIKAETTAKTEAVIAETAIYASNTSTLPITGLAEASKRPDQFIGIHFFSPVDKMPLVEIILGRKTGDKALAMALDYVRKIKKTPIVVNDSRGFYTSRCFATYPTEGIAMLTEGITPALIENAGVMAGMPVGPFAVGDEVSIELMYKVKEATKKALGDQYQAAPSDDVIDLMVTKLGRLGKKTGKGFYDYPEGQKKHLWPGLTSEFPEAKTQPSVAELKKRFLYRQAIECARCFEEGVVTDPADADVGAIFGWGFAPHTGGPLSMIDTIGAATFVAECDRMAQAYGPRFSPPKILRDMATANRQFYPG